MQDDQDEFASKTRRKKDMLALQQLESMQLPEALQDAVNEARRLARKHEALRRQLQYIGRLMRDIDAAPIRERLEQWQGQGREHTAQLHAIERWRDALLADDPALARFLDEHPHADSQKLRSLIRNARREQSAALPPKSYRELFRCLRETISGEAAADV